MNIQNNKVVVVIYTGDQMEGFQSVQFPISQLNPSP